jgi:hypothetical protein
MTIFGTCSSAEGHHYSSEKYREKTAEPKENGPLLAAGASDPADLDDQPAREVKDGFSGFSTLLVDEAKDTGGQAEDEEEDFGGLMVRQISVMIILRNRLIFSAFCRSLLSKLQARVKRTRRNPKSVCPILSKDLTTRWLELISLRQRSPSR